MVRNFGSAWTWLELWLNLITWFESMLFTGRDFPEVNLKPGAQNHAFQVTGSLNHAPFPVTFNNHSIAPA
jgi:hypothetical protein